MSKPLHEGGCRCGNVRFSASADPHYASYCHCADCRRATGAPVVAYTGFHVNEITWHSDAYRSYGNSPVQRLFCADCGAPVAYRDERLPGRIYVYTAALDAPERFPPESHGYSGERISWLQLNDDLPRHEGTTLERPMTGQEK